MQRRGRRCRTTCTTSTGWRSTWTARADASRWTMRTTSAAAWRDSTTPCSSRVSTWPAPSRWPADTFTSRRGESRTGGRDCSAPCCVKSWSTSDVRRLLLHSAAASYLSSVRRSTTYVHHAYRNQWRRSVENIVESERTGWDGRMRDGWWPLQPRGSGVALRGGSSY